MILSGESIRAEIAASVAAFTMVPASGILFTIEQVFAMIRSGVPGHLVECGVWKGGCGLAMLMLQRAAFGRVERTVHFMDSFQGLPPAEARDGPAAAAWQSDTKSSIYFDNCRARKLDLESTLQKFGFSPGDYRIWPGWFAQTTPLLAEALRTTSIALLRLDGDWYKSTETCLKMLMPVTSKKAVVIIDDYYAWDGCARAVHEYLALNDLPYRIKSIANDSGAYFVKDF